MNTKKQIESMRGRSVPVSEADMVLAAIETGEWELQRLLPQTCFTSEANIRNAWSVKRSAAPYCTKDGLRTWTGATPLEALCNGAAALGVELPGCSETAALPKTVVALLGEQAELRRLSDCCPELNLSNYGHDDVDELNGWAIEVSQCIDRALAAQPAGAQQPGTAYAALPDADRDYMRKVVAVAVTMLFDGYKGDVTRVFSTGELSEFVTITAAMGGERVEDIYRRAWDLLSLPARASHWQAPAQAAPDVSGYVSEWSGGLCTSDEAMDGIAKLYAAQADSALKDHQIAALVNELRDIAVEFHGTQQLRERIARVVVPALKAKTADSVLEDTARLDWLDKNIFHREMSDWDAKYGHGNSYNMWVLFSPKGAQGSARNIIDAARAAQGGKKP